MYELVFFLLKDGFHVFIPDAFTSIFMRIILALITSLAWALYVGPKIIKKLYEIKMGQPIREWVGFLLGELHKNKKNTPTMGGIIIISSIWVSSVIWMNLRTMPSLLMLGTLAIYGFLGGYDDYLKLKHKNSKGLSASKKMIIQIAWAAFVVFALERADIFANICWMKEQTVASIVDNKLVPMDLSSFYHSIYIPFVSSPLVVPAALAFLVWGFMAFVIVGSSNAVNLTDGLDGLASGLVIMVSLTLAVFAFLSSEPKIAEFLQIPYISTSGDIAIFLTAVAGAVLGFLWFNCAPAQVFMGDVGSLSLGGVLGVAAVILNKSLLYGLIGFVFVMEALSVIIQVLSYRYRNKKRVFLCAPLHHHFEYQGLPETKVVARFWIVGFILCLIGLLSLKTA